MIQGKYFDLKFDNRFPLEIPINNWQNLSNYSFMSFPGCIYLLKANNIFYVGADKNGKRPYQHKSKFLNNKHNNNYMQNVVNKYSLSVMFYQPLIQIPKEYLIYRDEIENSYIKLFDTYHNGYNLVEFATTPLLNRPINAKNWEFINPEGERVKIFNLYKFCQENGLSRRHMSSVASGERGSHKGWKSVTTFEYFQYQYKTYSIINPKGDLIEINNLPLFCKINNLNNGKISQVCNFKRNQYKGWRPNKREYIGVPFNGGRIILDNTYPKRHKTNIKCQLISPSGEIFNVENVCDFCEKFNLTSQLLYRVIRGVDSSHKGWSLI